MAGTSVIAARFVSGSLGPFTIAAASLFFAMLCLIPLCGRRLRIVLKGLNIRNGLPLLLQALFGIFLFRMFLLQGLIRTSTGEAGILTGATPAITYLLAIVILKEPLRKIRIIGLVITITGILLVQGILLPDSGLTMIHFAGNILVLCAATCEAIFNVLSRFSFVKAATDKQMKIDILLQTTLVTCIAFLLCLVPAFMEKPIHSLLALNVGQWLVLVWYGVVVTALAFFFWYAGIKRCEASIAAVFSGMMPFTALLLSVIILGERPAWLQYIGGLLVIAGMVVSGFNAENKAAGNSKAVGNSKHQGIAKL